VTIQARGLTKHFGDSVAVDGLSFDIRPGIVTGFLGPNGSGKSTTMRLILGLDHPTAGSVTLGGRRYRELDAPMREVGALLDARTLHGKRTARQQLRWLADAGGLPRTRRGGARRRRPGGRRRPPCGRVLAWHVPAPGHRGGAAGRPGDAALRRADERSGSRGHPLGAHDAAALRRRGAHGRRVEPPHARDGGDGRARARHRSRAPDRRHEHRRVHAARGGQPRARRVTRRGRARLFARARRRAAKRRRGRLAGRRGAERGGRRRPRRRARPARARAHAAAREPRVGVHGAHRDRVEYRPEAVR
jgi:ABC-type Fe3+/spermidine/putrescine transport system ATPase subunit